MRKYLLIFYAIIAYTACYAPAPQKEFTGKKQFRTTDPSRLYFKNMRSTYYYRSRRPNSKKDIYQLKKISSATDRPILKPVIINDWLADQAYIFIEKNDYPHFHPDTLQVYWLDADTTGMFFMTTPTKEAQYEFAGEVYEALMTGKSLKLKTDKGELMPFLNEEKDALHFVTILRDYYRLTEVR